ncbi:hypothetical protein NEHOM01_2115 [Nematocida homosporus]|uniref:uncharacterized protein n=1 Tax=Nematocida homosporus TaxID=1912981 RepID=UPI00221F5A52|nr:uncharacterized protein NEHOM01_2115 [Nematocida homosporus]KAI5187353.1 hypothetical protein NEHOM01_2115 [Nematocida homosporus]
MRWIVYMLCIVGLWAQSEQLGIQKQGGQEVRYMALEANGYIFIYDVFDSTLVDKIAVQNKRPEGIQRQVGEGGSMGVEGVNEGLDRWRGINEEVQIVGQGVLVRDHRIAVEYVQLPVGMVVLVYDEYVAKLVEAVGAEEWTKREVRCVLGKTYINRADWAHRSIAEVVGKYGRARMYFLKRINGNFYLSEVQISEIAEAKQRVGKVVLEVWGVFLVFSLCFFAALPGVVRIYVARRCPIELDAGEYRGLHEGRLFRTKPVFVLELLKGSAAAERMHRGLVELRQMDKRDCIVYIEETSNAVLVAYTKDLVALADLGPQYTFAKKGEIIWWLIKKVAEVHARHWANIDMSLDNIFIREADTRLVLLGLTHFHQPDPAQLSSSQSKDCQRLGLLFYELVFNRPLLQPQETVAQAQARLHQYHYQRYPKFYPGHEPRQTLEVLDCIVQLLSPDLPNLDQIITHPVFWSSSGRFEFIALFSDYLFDHPEDKVIETSQIMAKTEMDWSNWDVYLNLDLYNHLIRYGKYLYNTKVIRDLYRIFRNNGRHFQSIPDPGRHFFQNTLQNYINYFLDTYPYLTLFGHAVASEYRLFERKLFQELQLHAFHV